MSLLGIFGATEDIAIDIEETTEHIIADRE